LTIGSTDLGQGCKTAPGRMAIKELRISYDQINVLNSAADAPPFCLGSFASRVTLIAGNAVVSAGRRARGILFDLAAKELEASASDLMAAKGKI